MKLSPEKQKKLALTVVIVVGALFGVWWFGICGLEEGNKRDDDAAKQTEGENKKLDDKIKKEESDHKKADRFQEYMAELEQKMPKGSPDTWLAKELGAIAGRQKLTLLNTTAQPLPELTDFKFGLKSYQLVGFRFEFKGDLNAIGEFLETMENTFPLIEVEELNITASSDVKPHVHTVAMRVAAAIKPS